MAISRRDFLKLSSLLTASSIIQPGLQMFPKNPSSNPNAKNVLIIVFDALSATNINFYGYPRETMPNLTRLLDRATVYHNHYASSNFTTPGTASLLTGKQPWEHLALKLTDTVKPELANKSIFSFFNDYYKLAYTHNYIAEILLDQFSDAITQHAPINSLLMEQLLTSSSAWLNNLLKDDLDTRQLLYSRLTETDLDGYLYSLLFPSLIGKNEYQVPPKIAEMFPRGIPLADKTGPFLLEDAIDWTMSQAASISQPFLSYLHFLPPHGEYTTRIDLVNAFLEDGFHATEKKPDPFAMRKKIHSQEELELKRRFYDEYILYVDAEFDRLFTFLDQQGNLSNTLVVLTSDHGELVERGVNGHNFPYLFEPVVKVPLVIFEPDQKERKDIHSLTSSIDLLPTLLDYTNHQIPPELPGQILPPFGQPELDVPRTIYSFYASYNTDYSHLTTATLSFRRENFKVIRYSGYTDLELFNYRIEKFGFEPVKENPQYLVFDLENDPEELNNLALSPSPAVQALINELEQFYRNNVEYPN